MTIIVLMGVTGSGKTTVGRLLAEQKRLEHLIEFEMNCNS